MEGHGKLGEEEGQDENAALVELVEEDEEELLKRLHLNDESNQDRLVLDALEGVPDDEEERIRVLTPIEVRELEEAGSVAFGLAEPDSLGLRRELQAAREQLHQQQLREEIAQLRGHVQDRVLLQREQSEQEDLRRQLAATKAFVEGTRKERQGLLEKEELLQDGLRLEIAARSIDRERFQQECLRDQIRAFSRNGHALQGVSQVAGGVDSLRREQLEQDRLRREIAAAREVASVAGLMGNMLPTGRQAVRSSPAVEPMPRVGAAAPCHGW